MGQARAASRFALAPSKMPSSSRMTLVPAVMTLDIEGESVVKGAHAS